MTSGGVSQSSLLRFPRLLVLLLFVKKLHNTSYHPNSLKTNIPYGRALRLKKISSSETDYQKSLNEMKSAFLKRGYQENHLSKQFTKASSKERSDFLTYKDKSEPKNNQLLFITTYNKTLPMIQNAFDTGVFSRSMKILKSPLSKS